MRKGAAAAKKNVEDIYPLSPMQQGMLFHTLMAPDAGMYIEQMFMSLHGELDAEALKAAWQEVVSRHPILRSSFLWEGLEKPLQVVRRSVRLPWKEEDWRGLPTEGQEKRLQSFLEEDCRQGFQLSSAPLLRLSLLRLGEAVHRFVWSYHHFLLDGWSVELVLEEVRRFYEAHSQGNQLRLGDARPYRNYIAWLKAQKLSHAKRFWRAALEGFKTPNSLPGDRPAPSSGVETKEASLSLEAGATQALSALARRSRLTLNTLVMGAWALLLHRLCGRQDIVFGAVVSGRPSSLPGVESMVGLFINTLPLRVQVDPRTMLLPWLQDLQAVQLRVREYEYTPLVKVSSWSQVRQGTPLFEAIYGFQNLPAPSKVDRRLGPLEIRDKRHFHCTTGYPLNLTVEPRRELLLAAAYDGRRFEGSFVRRLLGYAGNLLGHFAYDPQRRLLDLPLLSPVEIRQLLDWSGSQVPLPPSPLIHELFESQCRRTPDSAAIVFGALQVSYRELDWSVEQLAQRLGRLGAGPEEVIGVCMGRSPQMPTACLAVLKNGGAYLPLDPSDPRQRLDFMLEDARASIVLTLKRWAASLPPSSDRRTVLCLDRQGARESGVKPSSAGRPALQGGNLAYLIYTSGSTGRPKGVCVTHQGVVRLVTCNDYLPLGPSHRIGHASNCSFDAATFELWGALLNGAVLTGLDSEALRSPPRLGEVLRRHQVSVLFLTTALFNQVARQAPQAFRRLAHLLFGGEAVDPLRVAQVIEKGAPGRLLHVYGPTEDTTFTTWHTVREAAADGGTVPIGRPIGNTQVHLLDAWCRPVPLGVSGEVCIGGLGLARGYWTRPALTADKFVPSPFGPTSSRLYRSGDLACFLPDGSLRFLGRLDEQVKVRGFRIEPGEVESALSLHPAIRQAAVKAYRASSGGRRLAAYVVWETSAPGLDLSELRDFLAGKLPDYMAPSAFVELEALPLTPSGKVDRRALPDPSAERLQPDRAFVAPRTPIESRLARIWADVLGLEQVGAENNFFELGGDSILCIQVAARAHREGLAVSTRQVVECATLAELAQAAEPEEPPAKQLGEEQADQAGPSPAAGPEFPLAGLARRELDDLLGKDGGIEDLYPLSPLQQGMLFRTLFGPVQTKYVAQATMRLDGAISTERFCDAWAKAVQRHAVLRSAFLWEGLEEPLQMVRRDVFPEWRLQDWRKLQATEQEQRLKRLLLEDRQRGFNLSQAPLARFALIRLDDEGRHFLFSFHHLLLDGWSLALILKEVLADVRGRQAGGEQSACAPPFRDYIAWLQRQDLAEAEAFWRQKLRGIEQPLAMGTFPTEAPADGSDYGRESITLSNQETAALRPDSRGRRLTLNTLIQGAWALLLSRLSGWQCVVFGVVISCRPPELEGVESMVGLLINALPLRIRAAPGAELPVWLREVQEAQAELQSFAYSPLAQVQRWSGLPQEQPLFESLLAFENYPVDPSLLESGLSPKVRMVETDYPLTLVVAPEARLMFDLHFDRRRFAAAEMKQLLGRLRRLLANLASLPDCRLGDLLFLSRAEQHQILREWNDRRSEYPRGTCIHHLVEAQARKSPHSTALAFNGGVSRQLSYGEADSCAGRLARSLRRQGAGCGSRVGICLDRSLEVVLGVLGILKSGAAYLPLDPEYPEERLRFMLQDASPQLVLISRSLTGRIRSGPELVFSSDGLRESAADAAGPGSPIGGAGPDGLAYVIYTSGSTGRPKGVMVAHRGLCNLWAAQARSFQLGPGNRVLQFASLNFDASLFEITLALCSGATLCLAQKRKLLPGPDLIRLLREWQVAALLMPPTALSALPAKPLPALRTVLTAGEPCSAELVSRWAANRRFFNLYGPTEATIWTTSCRCLSGDRTPPIGRPIANVQVLLLDRSLSPAAAGAPGELYIAGEGLARGYLNRPALTALRFLPHPFSARPGARMYRSGDLGRWRPDGEVEFLGRIDQQVKIRGFRIELGELEAVLASHPSVLQAAAAARQEGRGERFLAAYIVACQGRAPSLEDLRAHLRKQLPAHMLPSAFVFLETLPLMPSGKVDRCRLPNPQRPAQRPLAENAAPSTRPEQKITGIWRELLKIEQVGLDDNFFDLGGHSLRLVRLQDRLHETFGRDFPVVDLFRHSTVRMQARYLFPELHPEQRSEAVPDRTAPGRQDGREIAVIGMAGRFPGAQSVEEFWSRLRDGEECISFFSDEQLRAAGLPDSALDDPRLVKAGGVLQGIELFDAPFFGINRAEAELMDPQQRLLLETAWQALESAGYDPGACPGSVGVYAGAGVSSYWINNLLASPRLEGGAATRYRASILNDKDFLPSRVSYRLNLKGPSVAVQTSCSTSLVAIHQACRSLLDGECDMALAGGVSIAVPHIAGYFCQEGGIHSPDGHCRAFDAQARGTVPGNGAALVVLKRLDQAISDGDNILAVVKGSAINNDGAAKVGYTAPSIQGQAQVIRQALERAQVPAESITLIEAHGTGTELGDPVEAAALQEVFGEGRKGSCAIGSVKTNTGHLDAAAGAAGFIKAVLALQHKQLPPSLHFKTPNPRIDFEKGPFYVNTRLRDWESGAMPRRAGVSSFGISGTNAHAVLEEAPEAPEGSRSRPCHLLLLSARTETALKAAAANLAQHLKQHPGTNLADAAYTLQAGRKAFSHRRMALCKDRQEALRFLESPPGRLQSRVLEPESREVAFLFPGQGAQQEGMGWELYRCEPEFARHLDRCSELLEPHLQADLRQVLFGEGRQRENPSGGESDSSAAPRLSQTFLAQPALFAVEYALARLWMSWGIQPRAMIGHSLGEYAAACLAGVFTLEEALRLVCARGRLMQGLPQGSMMAVPLPPEEIVPLLGSGLSLAAVNEPSRSVVSGSAEAVGALERQLQSNGTACRRLNTSHAFHSGMMEPILEEFEQQVRQADPKPPRIPCISNLTGDWMAADQATDPGYWSGQLRRTVQFSRGIARLMQGPCCVMLEVGPGRQLSSAVRRRRDKPPNLAVVHSMGDPASETECLLTALGKLWLAGVPVDWVGFYSRETRRRLPLPTYPFERKRYWIGPADGGARRRLAAAGDRQSPRQSAPRQMPSAGGDAQQHAAQPVMHRLLQRQLESTGLLLNLASRQISLLGGGHSLQSRSSPPPKNRRQRTDAGAGAVSLTPIQQWFFDLNFAVPRHFNMSRLFTVPPGIRAENLERAFERVLENHEAFRLRFREDDRGLRQASCADGSHASFSRIDLSRPAGTGLHQALQGCCAMLQASLDISLGPLARAAFIQLGPSLPGRLLVVVHHLAVDITSWHILLEDLDTGCRQLERRQNIRLKPERTSFQQWARSIQAYSRSPEMRREARYWLSQRSGQAVSLPVDFPEGINTFDSALTVSASLSRWETSLLQKCVCAAHGVLLSEVLLAALAQVFADWTGSDSLLLDLEGHGREESLANVDLSRTVGWLTCLFPLLVRASNGANPVDALESVKRQLREVPRGGIGYGLLRRLSRDPRIVQRLKSLPQAQVSFNYLGRSPASGTNGADRLLLQPAPESAGLNQNLFERRSHLLQIDGLIAEDCLQLRFHYSRNSHRRSTIQGLARSSLQFLQRLTALGDQPLPGGAGLGRKDRHV